MCFVPSVTAPIKQGPLLRVLKSKCSDLLIPIDIIPLPSFVILVGFESFICPDLCLFTL